MGDEATPPLSRIIRAGGKHPARVDGLYLTSPADKVGRAVAPEEVIDRTAAPTRPIYLRTVPKTPQVVPRVAKPIRTADPEHALSGPDLPSGLTSRAPMPNRDAVIDQLGGARLADPPEPPTRELAFHEPGVFRSPSQMPPPAVAATPSPDPTAIAPFGPAANAARAAALAKAAELMTAAKAKAHRAEASQAQAAAEDEAEQRQEDDRNNEDALQDDEEAARALDEDAEHGS